jgi:hypothetical protein
VCIEATHGLAVAGVGDQVVKIGSDTLRLQEFCATGDAEIVPDQRIDTKTWIASVRTLTDDKGHVTEGRREPLKVTIQQVLRRAARASDIQFFKLCVYQFWRVAPSGSWS